MVCLENLQRNDRYLSYSTVGKFQYALDQLANYLYTHGVSCVPYTDKTVQRLMREHSQAEWQQNLREFESIYTVYQKFVMSGGYLSLSGHLTKFSMKERGWRTTEDVWENIEDSDVIEIYSTEFNQLFANLKFIDICSYEIMEMRFGEFPRLFARPQACTDGIVAEIQNIVKTKPMTCTFSKVPNHFLEEVSSTKKNLFKINQKIFAPVYSLETGALIGFMGTLDASLIGSKVEDESALNVTPLAH